MSAEPTDLQWDADDLAATADPRPPTQLVSLSVVRSALRRLRRFWLVTAVVGLVVGGAVFALSPATYTASTTLLLEHTGANDPVQAMGTDVALLQTNEVAQLVVDRLHLHETAATLLGQYAGVSVSDQVLQISLTAPSAGAAVTRADTLAAQFLAFRAAQETTENNIAVNALSAQLQQLNAEISRLTTTIKSLPKADTGPKAPATGPAAALQAEQDNDISSAAAVSQTIQSDNQNTHQVIAASSVLGPATAAHHSRIKPLATDLAIGLLSGLLVGLALVAAWALASDRLRKRDDIAAALATPIGLSLGRSSRSRRADAGAIPTPTA